MRSPESSALAPAGDLAHISPTELLRFCEAVRFTGTLSFESVQSRGALPMLRGVPEISDGDPSLERALDTFLSLTRGRYTLTQMLPPLEGAAAEGHLGLHGSIGPALTVADLLRYCEAAGLTGTLTLYREERACIARYERGDLVSLTLDEGSDVDLSNIFAWNTGGFAIRARSVFDKTRAEPESTDKFLKTVEVALAEIVEKSEHGARKVRAPETQPLRTPSILRGSTLPFGLEGAAAREHASTSPFAAPSHQRSAPPPGPDTTVKVHFIDRGGYERPSTTKHAAARLGAEVVQLASPPRNDIDARVGVSTHVQSSPKDRASEEKRLPNESREHSAHSPDSTDEPVGKELAERPESSARLRNEESNVSVNTVSLQSRSRAAPSRALTVIFVAVMAAAAVVALYTLGSLVR